MLPYPLPTLLCKGEHECSPLLCKVLDFSSDEEESNFVMMVFHIDLSFTILLINNKVTLLLVCSVFFTFVLLPSSVTFLIIIISIFGETFFLKRLEKPFF
jgi:hypothetical protein